MRADLRSALKLLVVPDGHLVRGTYAADDTGELVDTENVLFYNVGSASFRTLARTGLRFERAYEVPSPPDRMERADHLHYHRYSSAEPTEGFVHWSTGAKLAHIDNVRVTRLEKPGPLWAAIRAQLAAPAAVATGPRPFVVRLVVGVPTELPRSAAAIVKPLLDGVISAFHGHEGEIDGDLASRLEAGCGISPERAREALLDQQWAVLGRRNLVKPFSLQAIQWNPADEYCVAAEVLLDSTVASDVWRINGQIFEALR